MSGVGDGTAAVGETARQVTETVVDTTQTTARSFEKAFSKFCGNDCGRMLLETSGVTLAVVGIAVTPFVPAIGPVVAEAGLYLYIAQYEYTTIEYTQGRASLLDLTNPALAGTPALAGETSPAHPLVGRVLDLLVSGLETIRDKTCPEGC